MCVNWVLIAVVCLGLASVTVAAYWPVTNCGFVNIDDQGYASQNPRVLAGLSWSGWTYAWTSFVVGNWHPLTILSLELDSTLWGTQPVGYHVTNLSFHVANVLLLFRVLQKMTNGFWRSVFVAAFFALHPLHVESVAWISERKDVLSTFFLLLTIWAYVHYAIRPSVLRYLAVMILLSLGLLAKPMLVTCPILLMLIDCWPLNRIEGKVFPSHEDRFPRRPIRFLIVEKIPLLILAFADGLMTIVAQGKAIAGAESVAYAIRIPHAFCSYAWYLQKTFVPTCLMVQYPHPGQTVDWLRAGIGFLAIVAISAWVLSQGRKRPYLVFGWAWFVISLLPVIGLLQVGAQAYADRYAYIPHIGLFVLIVWEVHAWVIATKTRRTIGVVIAGLTLGACGVLTQLQIQVWNSGISLWEHVLEIVPESGMAELYLGSALHGNGDYELAIPHFERGVKMTLTGAADAYCNWGRCLIALDRSAESEQKFLAALNINDCHELSLLDLADLLVKQGRRDEAARIASRYEQVYGRRRDRDANDYKYEVELGLSQIRKGNVKQAIVHFEMAVQLAPVSAAAHNNLASAQLDLRLLKDAKANFLKALELNPKLAGAHFNLAAILESENDLSGAKHHYAEELRINPNDVEARQHLTRLSSVK